MVKRRSKKRSGKVSDDYIHSYLDTLYEHDRRLFYYMRSVIIKYISFYKKLNPGQLSAISYYKGPGYQSINSLLLNQPNYILSSSNILSSNGRILNMKDVTTYLTHLFTTLIQHIQQLDSVFDNRPSISRKLMVYRGVKNSLFIEELLHNKHIGDVIVLHNYVSTSLNPQVALQYSGYYNMTVDTSFNKSILFRIKLPKNTPCLYIPYNNDISTQKFIVDEGELLLNRGSKFKIRRIQTKKYPKHEYHSTLSSYTIYDLDYIGYDRSPLKSVDDYVSTIRSIQYYI